MTEGQDVRALLQSIGGMRRRIAEMDRQAERMRAMNAGAYAEELGRLASAQTGVPARCAVKVGKAPAAPAAAAPAQAAEHDKLDDLLAFSRQFDNIIIQE